MGGEADRLEAQITALAAWISESQHIVFFGGAGVSTESGIPDFRSSDGLYAEKRSYPPEQIVSHSFFLSHTEQFYEFYKERMLYPEAAPNAAHLALAELERQGKLSAVITQNMDGLHEKAGSKKVLPLHGTVLRNHCQRCGKFYDLEDMLARPGAVPHCDCGGIIKPDVVLYEEALDTALLEEAAHCIAAADMLIIGGTSLAVYPAAGLLRYFSGRRLVVINRSATPADRDADLVIQAPIGEVLSEAVARAH